jgi:acetyl esterase/lipase
MAAYVGYKVIEFDYRMPPDFPYPAGLDDAMAVWKAALAIQDPRRMAIIGASAGGGLTLAMILRAKQEGLPLPAAITPGTPASDLTDTGDSYKTNEWLDDVLVSYEGLGRSSALIYAMVTISKSRSSRRSTGTFHGFPPAILTTGTRDLLLSNTVRVHRKPRQAGVEAQLEVFEGLSHAQYLYATTGPETKEAFGEITAFFDRHLAQ